MRSRNLLDSLGIESKDDFDLTTSKKRFVDDSQYRFEVPGIQAPGPMESLLEEADKSELILHRVTQTKGIMTLTDSEIMSMMKLARDAEVELVLSIGPRASYDTSATYHTTEGKTVGYRLRGQDQVARALEDVLRAIDLGCISFLLYDEGLLWALGKLRTQKKIGDNVTFKISAHGGHGNACSASLLESLGADSINPVRDIQLPMLSAIRNSIDIPIDIHTENPASTGGFIRHYEVPEMIRTASPVYLKTGGAVAKTHAWETTVADAKNRCKQVGLVQRVVDDYFPEATRSPKGSIGLRRG